MRLAKILAWVAFIIMFVTISYGFIAGDFAAEGAQILAIPWGQVTLIDIYVSFFIFCGWIVYREKSWKSLVWIGFVIILGSLTQAVYLLYALYTSKNVNQFWGVK